ncbi:2-succinyl-5-enolpyruvyl-6-hydroxy-3-cyclohexene-1-carboxylic-acid synthase [Nocardioides acrostichi]|uniref:2-succinyl-5-enolpyruvyl-6-hydroxy-3- cyclohexene-1-carboxylic-acid synthase n=1 Tax=Nocardioides acrostichi TaxID=2784339 RepID=UPI002E2BFAB6|nr:2-succinyl-5-enolpyruvyl-6-hydroxy-3-cyclohexene-1-carboxylic-acid synthase [Nocardioides acrostichi]
MTLSSSEHARAVVRALVDAGVREVVVSPGSRNAPLSFAVFDAAAAGVLRLHTRIDERSGAFLALGLAKTGPRAAVLCTSGTAVANLHPALLEAAHAGVPLVAVTADRPPRLRGTGANQTTDQVGVFGPLVRTVEAEASAPWVVPEGVVHLNVPLDDPLVPVDAAGRGSWGEPRPDAGRPRRERPVMPLLDPGPRTVVVAGDDAGPPARLLAQAGGWPLLAEPTSGSRTGTHPIRTYRVLLGDDAPDSLTAQIERVVVFGHPTLSRPVMRLLARPDVEVLAGPAPGVWNARPFRVDAELAGWDPDPLQAPGAAGWLEAWRAADASVSRRLDALLAAEPRLTPHEVAGAVSGAVRGGGLLFVGASNPVRDLDLMAGMPGARYAVGDRRKVIANRGLAGIDGTISTAIGAALGRPSSSHAIALMGDVTFLHDSGGLVRGPDEPEPDLVIVVVNDDGGSIFATLEQGAPEHIDRFERLFGTPHGVDLGALCAATRTPHVRVDSLPELEQALASPNGGIEVVEARVDRSGRRDLDTRIRALRP